MKHALLAASLSMIALVSSLRADEPAPPPTAKEIQAKLEKNFETQLSGGTLAGYYTVTGQKAAAPKEEKYTLAKVSKLSGEIWLFQTRIQYNDHDVTVPLPIRVKWAGDTAVITVDDLPVPGLGTFDARVLIHDGFYAGTWGAKDHGGHLYGRVIPAKPAADKPNEEKPAVKKSATKSGAQP